MVDNKSEDEVPLQFGSRPEAVFRRVSATERTNYRPDGGEEPRRQNNIVCSLIARRTKTMETKRIQSGSEPSDAYDESEDDMLWYAIE